MSSCHTEKINAIDHVYREMREQILSIFRQCSIPEAECEDLTQDVFVKLMQIDVLRLDTIQGITATIALRMRTDYLRRKAFIRKAVSEIKTANMFDTTYNDEAYRVKELHALEQKIVDGMCELNRKIYSMSRFEQKSYAEIADTLNMSYRAVESRLYRSRAEVRENLAKAGGL